MEENKTTCSVHDLALYLKISPRYVQRLVKKGIIPRGKRGQYDLIPAIHAYIAYLKDLNKLIFKFTCDHGRMAYRRHKSQKKKRSRELPSTDKKNINLLNNNEEINRALALKQLTLL